MPNNVVKSFSAKSGDSVDKVESHWKKAEGIVQKEYGLSKSDGEKYYKLVTSIVKKMSHLKEYYDSEPINIVGFKKFYTYLTETHAIELDDDEEDDEDVGKGKVIDMEQDGEWANKKAKDKFYRALDKASKVETTAEKAERRFKYNKKEGAAKAEQVEKDKKVEKIWSKVSDLASSAKYSSDKILNKHTVLSTFMDRMSGLYRTYKDVEREKAENPQYSKKIFVPLIFNIFGVMSELYSSIQEYKWKEEMLARTKQKMIDKKFNKMSSNPEFRKNHGHPSNYYDGGYPEWDRVNEETVTGDIAHTTPPLGVKPSKKKKTTMVSRHPDGKTSLGHPFFDIDDNQKIKKLLDGRQKYERWEKSLDDKGIHSWAKKNRLKSFYVRTPDGVHVKVR